MNDNENVEYEANEENSQESRFSQSSNSQNISLKRFKKEPWLNNYFDYTMSNNKLHIKCKQCTYDTVSRNLTRLKVHLKKCFEETLPIEMQPNDWNTKVTNLWTKVIVENGLSFKCIESQSFKDFAEFTIRNWIRPQRRELSSVYIPLLASRLEESFIKKLRSESITHLTIEFDHWDDVNDRHLLGVIATFPSGDKHLIELRDQTLVSSKAELIVADLKDSLRMIPPNCINAIISDSAKACKKARRDLTNEEPYMHIIHHSCLAHLFNNIGSMTTTWKP